MPVTPVFSKTIAIPQSVIDENGHVNNVAYVQWMQDIAIEHYTANTSARRGWRART
jgi:acyl-CoA thioester hydrolase